MTKAFRGCHAQQRGGRGSHVPQEHHVHKSRNSGIHRGDHEGQYTVLHQINTHGLGGGGAVFHRQQSPADRAADKVGGNEQQQDKQRQDQQIHLLLSDLYTEEPHLGHIQLDRGFQRNEGVAQNFRETQRQDCQINSLDPQGDKAYQHAAEQTYHHRNDKGDAERCSVYLHEIVGNVCADPYKTCRTQGSQTGVAHEQAEANGHNGINHGVSHGKDEGAGQNAQLRQQRRDCN